MKNVIYRIRNITNDKFYIGSATDSRKRFWEHRKMLRNGSHHSVLLQRAWNKYGEDFFKFEIVRQLKDRTLLQPEEQKLLDEHFGKNYCYNASPNADTPSRNPTPEHRKRLSEATKEQWKHSDPRTGKKHSSETRALISQNLKKAHKEGRGIYKGYAQSEEHKNKISKALKGNQCAKGYKRTDAEREAIRQRTLGNQNWLGKHHTEESKAKMSKRVIELTTNTEFPSLTAVLEHYGFKMPTLRRALKSGKPISKGEHKGLHFQYLTN